MTHTRDLVFGFCLHIPHPGGECMENEVLIVGAGLLGYVVIPGLLVMWDRVLDFVGRYDEQARIP